MVSSSTDGDLQANIQNKIVEWEEHKAKIDALDEATLGPEDKSKLEKERKEIEKVQFRVDHVNKLLKEYNKLGGAPEETKLEHGDKVKAILKAIETSEKDVAERRIANGESIAPRSYAKDTEIEEYRDKMSERKYELERDFIEKAKERREQTYVLEKDLRSFTEQLLGMIDSGRNDEANAFIDQNLFDDDHPDGILPGPKEEVYMAEGGGLDAAKVREVCAEIIEAIEERIQEIEESQKPGSRWEEQISEMLEAPFVEMDQLIVQYCYGDESIRTPFQILEDCEAYWDKQFEWRKADLGAIKRVDPEKPQEEQDATKEEIVQQVKDLKKKLLGDDWERLSDIAIKEYEKEEKERLEKEANEKVDEESKAAH